MNNSSKHECKTGRKRILCQPLVLMALLLILHTFRITIHSVFFLNRY